MPNKGKKGEFAPLPSTLARSPKKAGDTYEETLESAEQSYAGDEERAHRVAWGAVKHSFEKTGDHWEAKAERGPSDPLSEGHGPQASGASYGGVDVDGRTKSDLLGDARARGLDVTARMTKPELAKILERANDRETRRSRKN